MGCGSRHWSVLSTSTSHPIRPTRPGNPAASGPESLPSYPIDPVVRRLLVEQVELDLGVRKEFAAEKGRTEPRLLPDI